MITEIGIVNPSRSPARGSLTDPPETFPGDGRSRPGVRHFGDNFMTDPLVAKTP